MAALIDPDKADEAHLNAVLSPHNLEHLDLLLVGGSLLTSGNIQSTLKNIRRRCSLPLIIFPGEIDQVSEAADAILLLSLISGRNPELLIGKHVAAALSLKQANIEIIPTGYMLIDGGTETTASYVSGTKPLPANKPGIAAMTALAGSQLGLKVIYMDAGSGAIQPVSAAMIREVRKHVDLPVIVGGGIKTGSGIEQAWDAGADVVVVGNALESNPDLTRFFAARKVN